MPKSHEFDLSDILSVTTGCLVSSRRMKGIYDILNFMTDDDLSTIALVRATEVCGPAILSQHPQLNEVSVPNFEGDKHRVNDWIAKMKKQFGDKLTISPLPPGDWQQKSQVDEALDMGVDPKKIIVVDLSKPDLGLGKPNT